jgi:hypothetical protein
MRSTNIDTVSEIEYLEVKTKNGNQLELQDSMGLFLTNEFIIFDSYIETSRINVGDKFKAITINGGQLYYIFDIISSKIELDKYILRLIEAENRLTSLESRVTSLESRMTTAESTLENHENRISSLERRI